MLPLCETLADYYHSDKIRKLKAKINVCKRKGIVGQSASPSAGVAAPLAQGGNVEDSLEAPSVLL